MNREQLAHIVRPAARIADDNEVFILGSQSVLATAEADDLPEVATLSVEADVAFWGDDDAVKADDVDGAIGELSSFHEMNGYYAQGVTIGTAVLPEGWQTRVIVFARPDTEPGRGLCLEVHDLVVSKLVAGRPKDLEFAEALLAVGMVEESILHDRAATIDRSAEIIRIVRGRIVRCAKRALNTRS